jgi:hypothetical protein
LSVHTGAPSNQEGIHRIQVIQRNQELSGRTLRGGLPCLAFARAGFGMSSLAFFGKPVPLLRCLAFSGVLVSRTGHFALRRTLVTSVGCLPLGRTPVADSAGLPGLKAGPANGLNLIPNSPPITSRTLTDLMERAARAAALPAEMPSPRAPQGANASPCRERRQHEARLDLGSQDVAGGRNGPPNGTRQIAR